MDAIDGFSELPEPIIHQIMSFLPTKCATRMSSVSKKFKSAWLSFPIIDFDMRTFRRTEDQKSFPNRRRELFMVFVYKFLQRREPKTGIQKLSFRSDLTGLNSEDRLDWMINYALRNNVQELDLDGGSECQRLFHNYPRFCRLPKAPFLAKSVRVLKVDRFNLETQDLILSCPLLEDFKFNRCSGMKTIRVSSTLLKAVEVSQCVGLQRVDIDAPNLESFSFNGRREDQHPDQQSDIDIVMITDCKPLRNLTLKFANITDQWLEDNLPRFPCLENLKLADCSRLKDAYVCLASIKEIEFDDCVGLRKIYIDGPNLQSFLYSTKKYSKPCEINISACKCLRKLALDGAAIKERWIKDNMSAFPLLEALKLSHCQLLKKIQFRHKLLKSLKLIQCTELEEAEIDTPKLLSFVYEGKVNIPPPVITSSHWIAMLKLSSNGFLDERWFTDLRNFLAGFDNCKVLTLVCGREKELTFPTELREKLLPPLYDITHAKIKLLDWKPIHLVELMESLLWLIPRPETLSFVKGKKERSLKFQYDESMADLEEQSCCWSRPIKCWSHTLKSVAMENFEDNVFTENVKEFFIYNALKLDTIYENSKGFRKVQGKLVQI